MAVAIGSGATNSFVRILQDEMDKQIALWAAQPTVFGPFDQEKYDAKLHEIRSRRAEMEAGRKVCDATGEHVWGAVESSGGVCEHCRGDGLAHGEEYGSAWDDCSNCAGLGYTSTEYSRRCERCGFNETRTT
jgi:hypothetical protein